MVDLFQRNFRKGTPSFFVRLFIIAWFWIHHGVKIDP